MTAQSWPIPSDIPPGVDRSDPAFLELYKSMLAAHIETVKHDLALSLEDHNAGIARQAAAALDANNRAAADSLFYTNVLTEYYKGYVELAKASLDRSFSRAQRTQEAVAAVGVLYTGILAYLVTKTPAADNAESSLAVLQSRAMIPTFFLATSLVFSIAYIAFLAPQRTSTQPAGAAVKREDLNIERNTFVRWAMKMPNWKIKLSQLSVIALGFGVATLPIGFIDIDNRDAARWVGLAVVAVLLIWLIGWFVVDRRQDEE
jgi:hypothetical protein